jgi:hypothetical protein
MVMTGMVVVVTMLVLVLVLVIMAVVIVSVGLNLWSVIVRAARVAVAMVVMGMPLMGVRIALFRLKRLAMIVRRAIGHVGLQSIFLLFDTLK